MSRPLEGVRVLVVEDRTAIAMALCDAIEESGGVVIGPAARLSQAARLIEDSQIDIGVLDVDLDGEPSFPAAMSLRERHVPVVLLTGYGREAVPPALASLEMMEKPVALPEFVRRLAKLAGGEARS